MTERDPAPRRPQSPPPPRRPQFEFRGPPPSASVVRRPFALGLAVVAWLAAAVAGLVAAGLALLNLDELTAMLQVVLDRDFPDEAAATRERVVDTAAALLVGGLVIAAVGQAALAAAMRAGRGWARWALLLPTALGSFAVLFLLGVTATTTERVALLLSVTFAVVAAVAMFLPGSGAWFTATRR